MTHEVSQDDLEISDFDIIDYLDSTEAIATYLNILFEDFPTNEAYLSDALGAALRASIALSDDPTKLVILLGQLEENDSEIPASLLFNLASVLRLQVAFQAK